MAIIHYLSTILSLPMYYGYRGTLTSTQCTYNTIFLCRLIPGPIMTTCFIIRIGLQACRYSIDRWKLVQLEGDNIKKYKPICPQVITSLYLSLLWAKTESSLYNRVSPYSCLHLFLQSKAKCLPLPSSFKENQIKVIMHYKSL